jgi:archaemetzincin
MESGLLVVPVGNVDEGTLEFLRSALGHAFGRPCSLAPALPNPSYAFNKRRGQYLSSSILQELARVDLSQAWRVLGVADLDVYVPELNFVFGQARVGGRTAVIALPRLRQSFYGKEDDPALFRDRLIKEAVHELGHTLGLGHCPDPLCVMHFSNSLQDTDIKGRTFCASCRPRAAG